MNFYNFFQPNQKLSMQDDENLEYDPEALIAMPVEVLANLFGRMDFEDVVRYCAVNTTLRDICSRRGLLEARARQYVQEWAPLSTPVTNNVDHAILIARGFVTHYNYDSATREVIFGNLEQNPDSFNFHIIGLPPARGTQIHLVCNPHWHGDFSGWAVPYPSVEDIYTDMKWTYRYAHGLITEPPARLFDHTKTGSDIIDLLADLPYYRVEGKNLAYIDQELKNDLDALVSTGAIDLTTYAVVELP